MSLNPLPYCAILPHCTGAIYLDRDESINAQRYAKINKAIKAYFNVTVVPQFPFHHCTIAVVTWRSIVWVLNAPLG